MTFILQRNRLLALALLIGNTLFSVQPVISQEPLKQSVSTVDVNPAHYPVELLYHLRDANHYLVTDVMSATDELFGASLRPIDDVLRSQLKIPAKEGLLVTALKPAGPCAQAGLLQNDVLLRLAGKPLTSSGDVTKQLEQAGSSSIPLEFLRGGKTNTIQIQPMSKVTFAPASPAKTEYYLGVSLEPVEESLRAQLPGLSNGAGVVVSEVSKGSPAEKVGLQKHDVALAIGGQEVTSSEMFARAVQENKDAPTQLTILRAGKTQSVSITPASRKVVPTVTHDLARWAVVQQPTPELWQPLLANVKVDEGTRLDKLEKELKSLRAAVNNLAESLKKSKPE
jgi:serine protease Do